MQGRKAFFSREVDMNFDDSRIGVLAKNIIAHDRILTNDVVQLGMIYNYLNKYFNDVDEFLKFYEEIMYYAAELKYGDLYFFQVLFEDNYDAFKAIIAKINQDEGYTKSIDEMIENTKELENFINEKFANTHIKIDLLDYVDALSYYIERIQVHTNMLSNLKQ